ncbi:hypothetical protein LVJ94_33295 [Pendulispora rubella]|uniref:Lipoprotein n=1 Tax=Pendulispora rubella TaxID=2741070 RepID=A0ABZ2KUM6_9BACT
MFRALPSLACVASAVLMACGTIATPTGGGGAGGSGSEEATSCSFGVLTASPASGYEEIGSVDMSLNPLCPECSWPQSLADFREAVRPEVCKAGGDMVLAVSNGLGYYIKGTILRRVETPPAQAAAVSTGCQYDTQCKGERLCVAGRCVEPADAGAPAPSSYAH